MIGLGLGLSFGRSAGGNPVLALFGAGDDGFLRDPRSSPMFSDAAASTPAVIDGPVRWFNDLFADRHVSAASDAARPILREVGGLKYIEFDGVTHLLRGLNSTLVLGAEHTEVMCFSTGAKVNAFFGGLSATSQTEDYAHFHNNVTGGSVGIVRGYTRFLTDGVARNFTGYEAGVDPATPTVFTRTNTASPGDLIFQVNGGAALTVASNWLSSTATAADTTLIGGPRLANTLPNSRVHYHFYINRVLAPSELAVVQNEARIAGGISAW